MAPSSQPRRAKWNADSRTLLQQKIRVQRERDGVERCAAKKKGGVSNCTFVLLQQKIRVQRERDGAERCAAKKRG